MRFAVVGLGNAARWLHLPAIRALEGSEVVGGADPSPAQREQWRTLEAGPAYERPEELIEKAKPEVVVVATPPDSHAALVQASLQAGAHVVCEKPFVETVAEAEEIVTLSEGAGRFVAINQEFRYMPIFSSLLRLVEQGRYGRPVFIQVTQHMDLPPWDEPVRWRAAMPNRTLFEGGVHIVDLIYASMGRLPERVFAATSSGLDPGRAADAIHLVTMDFGAGVLAQIIINRLSRTGTRYLELRLDCEEASLRASHGGRAYVQIGMKRAQRPGVHFGYGLEGASWVEQGERRRRLASNPRGATARATRLLYADAFDHIARGQAPPVSATAGRDTLRIIAAAYESAAAGGPVSLGGG